MIGSAGHANGAFTLHVLEGLVTPAAPLHLSLAVLYVPHTHRCTHTGLPVKKACILLLCHNRMLANISNFHCHT